MNVLNKRGIWCVIGWWSDQLFQIDRQHTTPVSARCKEVSTQSRPRGNILTEEQVGCGSCMHVLYFREFRGCEKKIALRVGDRLVSGHISCRFFPCPNQGEKIGLVRGFKKRRPGRVTDLHFESERGGVPPPERQLLDYSVGIETGPDS